MADWITTMSSQSGVHAADRPYLYLAELLHRVHNEYTCVISLTNRLAARSAHEETKTALAQIINRFYALAASHQMLRPPLTTASADLSANLTQLCYAMTSSGLAERGIELHLAVTEPVMLDAKRCWRAELIISELITNASRHAFAADFRIQLMHGAHKAIRRQPLRHCIRLDERAIDLLRFGRQDTV
jgi:two-component sensor histidine kinase